MTTDWPKTALEVLKLAPRYFAATAAFTGIVLFGPDQFLERLRISKFAENYHTTIGIVFVGSVCLFAVDLVHHIAKWMKGYWRNWNHRKLIRARLRNLTDAEKLILQPYLADKTRTCYFELGNGVVIGLEQCGILGCVSGDQNNKGFPYNISDTAWDYLSANRCNLDE